MRKVENKHREACTHKISHQMFFLYLPFMLIYAFIITAFAYAYL